MKNEISRKFRTFLAFVRIFLALFAKSRDSLSFPEHFCEIPGNFHQNFGPKSQNSSKNENEKWNFIFIPANVGRFFLLKFWDLSGAKVWESCRSRKIQQNEYLVAIVAVDTAENEPSKVWGWLGQTQTSNFEKNVFWKKFELLSAAQLILSCG